MGLAGDVLAVWVDGGLNSLVTSHACKPAALSSEATWLGPAWCSWASQLWLLRGSLGVVCEPVCLYMTPVCERGTFSYHG